MNPKRIPIALQTGAMRWKLWQTFAITIPLAACAPLEQRPPPVPLPQIVYREVSVPTPVPCFTEAERPILAKPTPIDLVNATVDQMAAALAADFAEEERYSRAVDALFTKCRGVTP